MPESVTSSTASSTRFSSLMIDPTLVMEMERGKVLSFLHNNGYPYDWDEEDLGQTIMVRCEDRGRTVAYVWSHWLDQGVMTAHVCTEVGAVLDWAKLMPKVEMLAVFVGCRTLHLGMELVANARPKTAPIIRRFLRRLGFTEVARNHFSKEIYHGLYEA